MAEFAVAVAVLATLLLGMPIISRYHELQVATIEGARLLAFESSWRRGADARPGGEALRIALFPAPASTDQPAAERIDANFAVGLTPGHAGQVTRALLTPFRLAAGLGSGFDIHDGAFHRADVAVAVSRPAELPEPFAGIPVTLSSTYLLLGDDWASSGPAQVARRAGGLVITRAARSMRALTALGTRLLSIVEPAFREFCPGIVDPERVPADRLSLSPDEDGRPPTRWVPTC